MADSGRSSRDGGTIPSSPYNQSIWRNVVDNWARRFAWDVISMEGDSQACCTHHFALSSHELLLEL